MEDIKTDLTELTGYVLTELFRRECSIEFVDVVPGADAESMTQILRARFRSNDTHYTVSIESPNVQDNKLDIEVLVTKFVTEDQLPPWSLLSDRDRVTVCRCIRDWRDVKDLSDIKLYQHEGLVLRLEHTVKFKVKCEQQNPLEQTADIVDQIFAMSEI